MKKSNKIKHIYLIWVLKIVISIYAWFNFFDYLPGTFTWIAALFFIFEIYERILVTIHKKIHLNNFWESAIDNYDNFFFGVIFKELLFWSTFGLIMYGLVVFPYGWLLGISDALFIYFFLLRWGTKMLAHSLVFLMTKVREMNIFVKDLDNME